MSYFFYKFCKLINIKKALQNVKYSDTILIVIGPEGGFDKKEQEKIVQHHPKKFSFR